MAASHLTKTLRVTFTLCNQRCLNRFLCSNSQTFTQRTEAQQNPPLRLCAFYTKQWGARRANGPLSRKRRQDKILKMQPNRCSTVAPLLHREKKKHEDVCDSGRAVAAERTVEQQSTVHLAPPFNRGSIKAVPAMRDHLLVKAPVNPADSASILFVRITDKSRMLVWKELNVYIFCFSHTFYCVSVLCQLITAICSYHTQQQRGMFLVLFFVFLFYQKGRITSRVTMKTAANSVKMTLHVRLQPA